MGSFFKGGLACNFCEKSSGGVLKLNFVSSFVQSIRGGGIGGNGNIVRGFSRPVESLDSNEAEVFALLVGCRELSRL